MAKKMTSKEYQEHMSKNAYNLPNTSDNLKNRYSRTMRATTVGKQYPKGPKRTNALKADSILVNKRKNGGIIRKK